MFYKTAFQAQKFFLYFFRIYCILKHDISPRTTEAGLSGRPHFLIMKGLTYGKISGIQSIDHGYLWNERI